MVRPPASGGAQPTFGGAATAGSGFGGFGSVGGGSGSGSTLSYLAEPPSFAAVSDPNVVVSFKNLLKKDATTKAKGLEELVAHAQSHPFDKDGGTQDAVLDVWVQLYPRTSIDNSRRVRELSHIAQLELTRSARKRMERRFPNVIATWLAGQYDRDRGVARAASDGLSMFKPEQVTTLWRRCQSQILAFAKEASEESWDTLSDQRSTTMEDAVAKFHRVRAAALSLVLGLLQRVDATEMDKFRDEYDDFFRDDTVWRSITIDDAAVRKTTCHLLFACIDRGLPYGTDDHVRKYFVANALKSDQTGSALEYVRVLTKLTQAAPEIWDAPETTTKKKKAPLELFTSFVTKGSRGSPPKYWEYLDRLLSLLPLDHLNIEMASALITSLKSGVINRDEPRTNTSAAWKCWIDTAKRLLSQLAPNDQLEFARQHLFPFFEQFLFSVSDTPVAIPLGPNAISIFVEAHVAIVSCSPELEVSSSREWERLAEIFCGKITNSLPEVSKDFKASQENVGEEGRRWFALVGQIHDGLLSTGSKLPDHTVDPSRKIISQCLGLLTSRNMKPFGAARVVEFALSTASYLFTGEGPNSVATFLSGVADDLVKALNSPSAECLLSCLNIIGTIDSRRDEYVKTWDKWITAALTLDAPLRNSTISSLLTHENVSEIAKRNTTLQEIILSQALETITGGANAWDLLAAAIEQRCLTSENHERLATSAVEALENTQDQGRALRTLELLVKGDADLFTRDEELHTALVGHLLSLSEISDTEISSSTTAIRALLASRNDSKLPIVGAIHANLERVGPQSLEVDTLIRQAKDALGSRASIADVFPNTRIWMQNLAPFFERPLNSSLTITNALGGVAAAVQADRLHNGRVPTDKKGRSVPARMALYSAKLLESGVDTSSLPLQTRVQFLHVLCLTGELVSDQLTTLDKHGLWESLGQDENDSQAEDLVSSTKAYIHRETQDETWWTEATSDAAPSAAAGLVQVLFEQSRALTPRGLYNARALSEIIQATVEAHGLSAGLEERLLKTEVLQSKPATTLHAAAVLTGLGQTLQSSKAASNFCNRLVSDVAGASPEGEKALITLSLLTISAQVYEVGELPVANNRVVFAVKQITSWLDEPELLSPSRCAEVCRCLMQLLPCMKDVYGSYWEKTVGFCLELLSRAGDLPLVDALPFIHASLKLMKTLENMTEPNDDLEDALKEMTAKKPKALIALLELPRERDSQPLQIVDSLLCREVEKIPVRHVSDPSDLFGLVASESRVIQTAAFDLLHRAIPAQQEQKSIDILLDKTDARLPDELLSLLLEAPTLEKYTDEALAQFPTSIRSYLLSWKLVFDAYSTSSLKVRNDFTENLKTDNYVAPFLSFLFDVLGHSAAHPLNLDKEKIGPKQILDYDMKLAESEPEEKNMHWLLVHLYYLTLKYISGLFRSWYIDCKSKQTKIAVEAWTTKYLSPLIVDAVLEEVQTWADNQEAPAADEQELQIKVSRAAREVTAGYEVDESQAAISIHVPESYPMDGVTVSSVRRVAVPENKWQNWIRTTQAVIAFSNGSVVDGLQVFRRNMVGALKGQGECAICYSIISSDKRMPDKRCTTCKNLFHRVCLYKWFQTSNQNTCPLCRNPIDYIGADTAKRRQV